MSRIPTEAAIAREMEETGLARLQAVRRIQQRTVLRERLRNERHCSDWRGAQS